MAPRAPPSRFFMSLAPVLLICGTWLAAPAGPVADSPAAQAATIVQPAAESQGIDVDTLVAQLSSPVFGEREQAQRALERLGPEVIAPLWKLTETGELDAVARCMDILGKLAAREDEQQRFAASAALEELAEAANPVVARRAKATLARQYRRVAEWVISLGGELSLRTASSETPQEDSRLLVRTGNEIPAGPLEIVGVSLNQANLPRETPLRALVVLNKQLQELSLSGTRIQDTDLSDVALLTELRVLSLGGTGITDAGIGLLESLKRLEVLDLQMTRIGDECVSLFAANAGLRSLDLSMTGITDASLPAIAAFPKLEVLKLVGTGLSGGEPLGTLHALTGLRELWLGGLDVSDPALAALGKLPRLESLGLYGTKVGDAGAGHIARQFPQLKQLWLGDTQVTSAALVDLTLLTKLEYLQLSNLPLSDEDGRVLMLFHKLRQLDLRGTKFSDAVIDTLRSRNRQLQVNH